MLDKELIKLINEAIKGDKESFEQLIEKIRKDILYIALSLTDNAQDGEDAAQEAVIKIQRNITGLKSPDAFRVWMYKVVMGICMDMKRKEKSNLYYAIDEQADCFTADEREALPYEYAEDSQKREELMQVITGLSQRYRACLLLFYYEGLSYAEIAEILNIPVKGVANILVRARDSIKRGVEKKSKTKLLLTSINGVASVPVLTLAFRQHASEVVSDELLNQVFGGLALGAGGTATTSALSGMAAKAGMSVVAKTAIGVIATATVAVGGYGIAHRQAPIQESPPVQQEQTEPEAAEPVTESQIESVPEEAVAEIEIHTLEDMIGESEAARLKGFVQQGCNLEVSGTFFNEIGLKEEMICNLYDEIYTLYLLDKQDKRLMVIVKNDGGQGISLVYKFTTVEEVIPDDMDILFSYEEWKNN